MPDHAFAPTSDVGVYVSFAEQDRESVLAYVEPLLTGAGLRVRLPTHDLRAQIRLAQDCEWFLVVVSQHALRSSKVLSEAAWAVDHRLRHGRIVVMLVDSSESRQINTALSSVKQVFDLANLVPGSPEHAATLAALPRVVRGEGLSTKRSSAASRQVERGAEEPSPAGEVDIRRQPSITTSPEPAVGEPLEIVVDLLLQGDPDTVGPGVVLNGLPADWQEILVDVDVLSPQLIFGERGSSGRIVLRRDGSSGPAIIPAAVDPGASGECLLIMAVFTHEGRFAGWAQRAVPMYAGRSGSSAHAPAAKPVAAGAAPRLPGQVVAASDDARTWTGEGPGTRGQFLVEPSASGPDLTITIFETEEGTYTWLLRPRKLFAELPARLSGQVVLGMRGQECAKELLHLFGAQNALADTPLPGADGLGQAHLAGFFGIGTRLWELAPACFKEVYQAMRRRHGRFSIQFVSQDHYIPWEFTLVRWSDTDGQERHEILAMEHPVARWITDYEGKLRDTLPAGPIVTTAPQYGPPRYPGSTALPWAQIESGSLVTMGARRREATFTSVFSLLADQPPVAPVALWHFAGHGRLRDDRNERADPAVLLEDLPLRVHQIRHPHLKLGHHCHPVALFNACYAGALVEDLVGIAGWAEAFMYLQFSGFIAPLWPVFDQDAATVTRDLVDRVWGRPSDGDAATGEGEPIAEVLRDIRQKYGRSSPTFLSYLFYGDVTARVRRPARERGM
jgi:hypothetical protein